MATGTIKWFSRIKGFGFIVPDEEGSDVFLHFSEAQRAGVGEPREGAKLEYEVRRGSTGKLFAGNVKFF